MIEHEHRTCVVCKKLCRYVEDDQRGRWDTVLSWGDLRAYDCQYGSPPYYEHTFEEQDAPSRH